ncbi:hypothetical protein Vadar_009849 [Vaccinium darrowii]|uniref:Uncharacterized protein n=1 Tax=Vaccinium darrowii TaxID=229202 RepID=A0ACB7YD49_9ERIC|nr:hypothetical protein Vadar_009849 [Vaccinium darrowii]
MPCSFSPRLVVAVLDLLAAVLDVLRMTMNIVPARPAQLQAGPKKLPPVVDWKNMASWVQSEIRDRQVIYTGSDILTLPPKLQRHNHAILVFGYCTLEGIDCWKIRNSHGTQWGMEGKGLIARNSSLPLYYPPLLTSGTVPEGLYGY